MEQDSNLRRQCHQIYSLAPLATWVSTRYRIEVAVAVVAPGSVCVALKRPSASSFGSVRSVATGRVVFAPAELAVRVELTTVGLQNRCSAD